MASAYARPVFKPYNSKADEADLPNILNREFNGYAPHTHIAATSCLRARRQEVAVHLPAGRPGGPLHRQARRGTRA